MATYLILSSWFIEIGQHGTPFSFQALTCIVTVINQAYIIWIQRILYITAYYLKIIV